MAKSKNEDNPPAAAPTEANRRRMERSREVAEREAARLARPEQRGRASKIGHARRGTRNSTPSGVLPQGSGAVASFAAAFGDGGGGQQDEEEEWCGPFSVARRMIAQREEAKRKREADLLRKQNGDEDAEDGEGRMIDNPLDEVVEALALEKKRKENPSMQWKGSHNNNSSGNGGFSESLYSKRRRRHQSARNMNMAAVPSLFQICVDFLVRNFDQVEALGNNVDGYIRRAICESLVAQGKFTSAAFDAIAEDGIESLELVDCAEVTQDQLSDALQKLIPAGLQALILNHAGRCFGPTTVRAITSSLPPKPLHSLFAISIGGAYLLTDIDAASLINTISHTVSSIEFKACPLIGSKFCEAIANGYSFSEAGNDANLTELSLEDLSLTKESLCCIATSGALRQLQSLSLQRIECLDDETMDTILSVTTTSGSLEGLNLSNNPLLTDATLSSIRKCNTKGKLRSLQLAGPNHISALGLEVFFTRGIPDLPPPPKLYKLDLSSCCHDAVNDTVVQLATLASIEKILPTGMGHSNTGGLVHLDMSGSTAITDKAMEHLASNCPSSLQELEVGYCVNISDKGLGYLVSKVNNQLSKITIWGCAQITDEFLDGHARVQQDSTGASLEILGAWMKQSGSFAVR